MAATFNDTDGRMQFLTDCIHFLNGICNKGDRCRFRHCSTAANQLNKCFKWPTSCRDENCRYRHPSLPKAINNQSLPLFPMPSERADLNRRQVSQAESPASIFWDIEDVYVPNNQKAFDIVQRIRQRVILELNLRESGFTCYCDIASISIETQRSLLHANVRTVHVPSHKPGSVHRQILLDLDRFERAHRPPAVIVLISDAVEFLGKLTDLRHQAGFNIITISNNSQSEDTFKSIVNMHYDWNMFIRSERHTSLARTSNRRNNSFAEIKNSLSTSKITCFQCAKEFDNERALQQHQEDKQHLYECSMCDVAFFTAAALKQHERKEKHFKKSFKQNKPYDHMDTLPSSTTLSHRNRVFDCPQCIYGFDTEHALFAHQERDNHFFRCPQCSQGFFSHVDQLQHQRDTNHGEPDFTCDLCGKSFFTEVSLIQHKKSTGHGDLNLVPFPPDLQLLVQPLSIMPNQYATQIWSPTPSNTEIVPNSTSDNMNTTTGIIRTGAEIVIALIEAWNSKK
ncbi:unnamed protein product [Rotaria socialis]|uniref:Uncharacterized protein n=1 Tax=Rotaria socialis TaxID=392032 RepID=A0A817S707_9BILA|nr:unnamed protein product [Rotaria socialis]CAF3430477.1 unnamed protein product [Rotaria socialis]CAF4159547.1 unnamed protein product [Rotaria socialis]CAF4406554.1 unnamed protein product [Rotaria socialis]